METPRWRDLIVSTPGTLGGRPRFEGTRIPVSLVLGYLADGASVADVLGEFDGLTDAHVRAALDFARSLAEYDVVG